MESGGIDIRLIGSLEVSTGEERLDHGLRGNQGRLAFAYLALNHSRPVPRAELEDAIWPDRPPGDPGSALATLLSRLRKVFGPDVVSGRAEIQLMLPHGSSIDVERCRLAVSEAEAARASDPKAAEARVAPELERLERPLLEGLEGAWLDKARREQEELRLRALELAARVALDLDDAALAEARARALVGALPYRESGHTLLMEALDRQGNTAEALRAYEDLRVMLRDELGTVPSREVAEFHRRLVGNGGPADADRVAAPGNDTTLPPTLAAALASPSPFLGRELESARLREAFDSRGPGANRLALISGDPGIGKTRLAAELAAGVAGEPALVLYGRATESALAQFQPFAEAIGAWATRATGAELREAAGDLPGAAGLVPQIARRLGVPGDDAGADRLALFDDVATLLARLSRARPVFLVLDDLHWADQPTLLMLSHLVRSGEELDALAVGTFRKTEAGPDLEAALGDLARDGEVVEISLGGLGRREISSMIEARTGSSPASELVESVTERSEGNPFFVTELVRQIAAAEEIDAPHLSRGTAAMLTRRLDGLDADDLEALTLAAVIGREFTFELLQRASGADEDALSTLLAVAGEKSVAAEVPGSVGRYSFDHALVVELLRERVDRRRRAQLHLRIAEALEHMAQGHPDRYAEELAHHFAEAVPAGGDRERAVEWAMRAGRRAEIVHAHERAASHYRRALELAGPDATAELRADLLLPLGEAEVRAGRTSEGRAAFIDAAAVARENSDGDRLAKAALGYGDSGGTWSMNTGETDGRLASLLEEALENLPPESHGLRAFVAGRLASELAWSENPDGRPDDLGREAIAEARRADDPDPLYRALIERAMTTWTPSRIQDRIDLTGEALEVARSSDDSSAHANSAMWHAVALAEDARTDAGWARAQEMAGEAVERARNAQLRWVYAQLRANEALADGRLEEAGERVGAMLAAAPESASEDPEAAAAYSGFLIMHERDELSALESLVDEQLAEAAAGQIAGMRMVAGLVLAACGRDDEAREQLHSLTRNPEMRIDVTWTLAIAHGAELAAELGDVEAAQAILAMARSGEAERVCVIGGGVGTLGAMHRYLGLLAGTSGQPEEAVHHFERAIEVNERKGNTLEAAHSRVDLAEAVVAEDPARASALAGEARAFADERPGLVRLTSRAERVGTASA